MIPVVQALGYLTLIVVCVCISTVAVWSTVLILQCLIRSREIERAVRNSYSCAEKPPKRTSGRIV